MKQTMKYLSMAALVVMGAVVVSCSKKEIDQPNEETTEVVEPAAEDNIVVCTTTVSFDTDGTKALDEDGVKTFAPGEKIAVIYKNTSDKTAKAESTELTAGDIQNEGKSATFTVTLDSPAENAAVRIIYPAAMAAESVATDVAVDADATINYAALNSQDGTLATLSSNLDLAVYDGNLVGTDLPADPAIHNKLAICLYTIKDNATPTANDLTSTITGMTISDGTYNYSVSRSAAAGPIYVAIRPTNKANISYTATDGTNYFKKSVSDKTYGASQMYPLGLRMSDYGGIDLSTLNTDYVAQHGDVLIGELTRSCKISIADGATVTLNNATINGTDNYDYWWSGLNCVGNATIILADGSENTVRGFDKHRAGIYFPENKTLTIQGSTGRLNVSSNGWAAGIGGSYGDNCGNIRIEGGVITATGCYQCPGIGASSGCGTITITGGTITSTGGEEASGIGARNCGKITITGGTVTATGGQYGAGIGCKKDGVTDGIEIGGTANVTAAGGEKAAGIGSAYCVGRNGTCGNISIGGTATVTATGGSKAAGIGSGYGFGSTSISSCGTITIANTVTSVTATKGADATNSIGKGEGSNSTCGTVTFGSTEGAITESPYTYPTPPPTGAINGLFSVSSTKQVYFSQGNLQATCASADADGSTQETWTWQFASNQYEVGTANSAINGNGSVSTAGTVDLFCWSTDATYYGISTITDNTGLQGAFVDWGGNIGSGWYTLSKEEWDYLFSGRTNAASKYGHGSVNGVNGMIILPDSWTLPDGLSFTSGISSWTNSYTTVQWSQMESAGAVFLPAAGIHIDTDVYAVGSTGLYWSSSVYEDNKVYAFRLSFDESSLFSSGEDKSQGCSVRLVRNAN